MYKVVLGNVRGRDGADGSKGDQGEKGDRGTSMRFRGKWTAGVQYQNTTLYIDVVFYNGSSFYCKNTITSANAPDVDPTNWGRISNGCSRILAELEMWEGAFDSYDGQRYYAAFHFPSGTFPSYTTPHFIMDEEIQRRGGVRFDGIQNDIALFSCTDPTAVEYTIGKLYSDMITTEVVTPL